ncbi:hypothetical protein F2P56_035895 [Juglans regia]|uniref:Reverse transcriptase domain-containing protein n=1 Tax=Juglans regia TaxID=51240 RepID=A0A833WC72_JUGRE|nr:hypothetical protein F2P56_035895 [Juglans regia]
MRIGTNMNLEMRQFVKCLLIEHCDVSVWSHDEMHGIDNEVIDHRLCVNPKVKKVWQKCRSFNAEKYVAIAEEVDRLLVARFILEAHYPEWMSKVVLVRKSNSKWKMCVDFTYINKACCKDIFSLPYINLIVDSTTGHHLLSFMDTYSRYNQIRMNPDDEEKKTFIMDQKLYCYRAMPFGLENAGATYQQLVNRMFKNQISHNIEVYVDNLIVKSKELEHHLDDLREASHSYAGKE